MRQFFGKIAARVVLFAFLTGTTFISSISLADTVMMNDGKKIKGLILDEYKDRIVISTADGERTIMKAHIRSAVYDDEERALLQIGRNQFKKGQYVKAYYTYDKAAQLNPDLEEARQKRDSLRSYLETKMRYDISDDIRTRNERFAGAKGQTLLKRAQDELGLVLIGQDDAKYVFIKKIIRNMSGKKPSPYTQGDRIVSVWGEKTAYMDPEEVAEMMLSPGEVKFVVERATNAMLGVESQVKWLLPIASYRAITGADLKLTKAGVVMDRVFPDGPFAKAGVRQGDFLCRVGGKNTRYMPLKEILSVLKDNQGKPLEIVFQRGATIWKKERP
jgi:C-terminal processing protease CtpA/Prc